MNSMPTNRTTEKAFGFTYDGWDEGGGDFGDVQFYKVEFTENFGPIKAGEKFDSVCVEHSKARLIAQSFSEETGEPFKEVVMSWKAVAVNSVTST